MHFIKIRKTDGIIHLEQPALSSRAVRQCGDKVRATSSWDWLTLPSPNEAPKFVYGINIPQENNEVTAQMGFPSKPELLFDPASPNVPDIKAQQEPRYTLVN